MAGFGLILIITFHKLKTELRKRQSSAFFWQIKSHSGKHV